MKSLYFIWTVFLLMTLCTGCEKEFLDKKPSQSLVVPQTLADYQSLLDNSVYVMNTTPYLSEISSDDIYTTDAGYNSQTPVTQNTYIWAQDIFQGQSTTNWDNIYKQVFYSNIVIDALPGLAAKGTSQAELDALKGAALFYRAYAFFNIAQVFAAPYKPSTASQDLGIPLRLSSNINDISKRGTLQQTYEQILADLNEAVKLLPVTIQFKTRPSTTAVQAMLSRVYLVMQSYDKALEAASASLKATTALIDYNTLDTTANWPVPGALPNGNDEALFYSRIYDSGFLERFVTFTGVDSILYQSYDSNDLRKYIFFIDFGDNIKHFRGNYSGGYSIFSGLASDEVLLTRAECYARAGNNDAAMDDLNALLIKRFITGTFQPLTATGADDALNKVLHERRKELVYRGTRWTDLRRLNQDTRFAVTLYRSVNGEQYTLPPNDNRYTLPIPKDVISLSGIEQNPR